MRRRKNRGRKRRGKTGEKKIETGLLAAEDEPEEFGVEEQDSGGNDPSDDDSETRVGELAHFAAVAGELDERNYGKGQLET